MPQKKPGRILSIDIGGSHVKAVLLDSEGKMLNDYTKVKTSEPATPESLIKDVKKLTAGFPDFDCVSAGFPGYVKNGVVMTAPNLGTKAWTGIDFRKILETTLGKPARLINDADMQGLGVVAGKGLEMVITLGTGMGFAMLLDGVLLPHLELSHHPITTKKDYDQHIGDEALLKIGPEKWNRRMKKIIPVLKTVFNYDTLYLGGGNASKITFPLDDNIKVISNKDGIKGGARLWNEISGGQ